MKITITLGQLKAAIEDDRDQFTGRVLRVAPLNKLKTTSLPMGLLFDLADLYELLEPKLKTMEAQRVELVKKHGTPGVDADGNPIPDQWQVTPGNMPAYFADYAALLDHTIEIEANQISRDELKKHSKALEKKEFNTDDVTALRWLIVRPEAEAQTAPVTSIAEHQAAKEAVA